MTFLAPWLLLGLVAAVIPLVLHLRRSRKRQTLEFSTIQFLDEAFVRAARRARIQELLIMLLRVAALVLLVVALAQPLLGSASWMSWFGGGSSRHVAIVIDNSASMQMLDENGQPLFDQARQHALDVLDALDPQRGDQATVILAGFRSDGPAVLFNEPTSDLTSLRQRLEQLEPTDLGSDVEQAVRVAAAQLGVNLTPEGTVESLRGPASQLRQIVVISDMQSPLEAMAVLPSMDQSLVEMLLLPVTTPGRKANVSIDVVDFASNRPVRGMPFTVRALVTNHSDMNLRPQVELVVEGQPVAMRELDLPAGRSRVISFTHHFDQTGSVGGSIGLAQDSDLTSSHDRLERDNRRYFALHIAPTMRIVMVNGAPSSLPRSDELFFLNLALKVQSAQTPGSPIEIESLQVSELDDQTIAGATVLVLANVASLSESALASVERYVDQGGSLLITVGDRVDTEAWNQAHGPQRLNGGLLPGQFENDANVTVSPDAAEQFVGWSDTAHPALGGFASGELGDLNSVSISGQVHFTVETGRILMETTAGRPLLIERDFGQGRVLLWTSSIDTDWTNFPVHPTFLPWLGHVLAHMAQETSLNADQRFIATGRTLTLPGRETVPRLRTPDGQWVFPSQVAEGWQFDAFDHRGLYRLESSEAQMTPTNEQSLSDRVMVAVNMPQLESRLRFSDRQSVTQRLEPAVPWTWVQSDGQRMATGQRHATGLWDPLLWLALIVILVEPWIANWMSSRSIGEDHRGSMPTFERGVVAWLFSRMGVKS